MHKGLLALGFSGTLLFAAFSSSSSYQLQNYGVGSGGTNSSSSTNYRLNAASGEASGGAATGGALQQKSGSIEAQQATVPLAPTLANGDGTYYNKLRFTIQKGGNDPADYTYAVAVSVNNFATTLYVQPDGTLGANAVHQSYTAWGGASGGFIIGLTANTAYTVKVNAKQGMFTESAYGPYATATTANPSLTFSMTPTTLGLGTLVANTVTASEATLSFGFTTNADSGGAVYVAGLYGGLKSVSAGHTIAALNADLVAQSTGYGLRGLATSQLSGGPFILTSPFNGATNHVGAPTTAYRTLFSSVAPVVNGSGSASVLAKASATTPSASDYSEVLTFIASASY